MTKIPIDPRFLAPRAHRHNIALFGHRDRRPFEIFFLPSLVAKLDDPMRFKSNLPSAPAPTWTVPKSTSTINFPPDVTSICWERFSSDATEALSEMSKT